MTQTILIKRSGSSSSTPSSLSYGELALNYADGKIFYKNSSGNIVEFSSGASGSFLSTSGGTLTGNLSLGDSKYIQLGGSNDLRLYHDGSNSYVEDQGTGSLYLKSNGLGIKLQSAWSGTLYDVIDALGFQTSIKAYGTTRLDVKSTGIDVTGNIAVTGTVDGRDVATDGTKLDTIATNANYITNNNQLTNGAGYITSADGGNATTLDGIDSSSFLRSDASDSYTSGTLTFGSGTGFDLASNDVYGSMRVIRNNGGITDGMYIGYANSGTGPTRIFGGGATSGGLRVNGSGNNDIKMGTSSGTAWHSANDGSGSGLDSDLLDGQHGSYYLNYNNFSNTPSIPSVGNGTLSITTSGSVSGGGSFTANQSGNTTLNLTGSGIMQGTNAVGNGSFSDAIGEGFRFQRVTGGSNRFTTSHHNLLQIPNTSGDQYLAQMGFGTGTTRLGWRSKDTSFGSWYEIWHSANDGSGSGLDADLLDGYNSAESGNSVILRTQSNGYLAINNWINIGSTGLFSGTQGHHFYVDSVGYIARGGASAETRIILQTDDAVNRGHIYANSSNYIGFLDNGASWLFQARSNGQLYQGNGNGLIWHAANDGSGSSLDADLLDGQHGSYYLNYNNFSNTPSIPSVGNGTLTILPGNSLTGSGTFTANQSGNTTISLGIDTPDDASASWFDVIAWDSNGLVKDTHVELHGSGYLRASYLNMSHSASTRNSDDVFYSSDDSYIRKNDADGFRTSLNVYSKAETNALIPSVPSVGNGQLTVQGAGSISGSGTFTANQSGNTTITLTGSTDASTLDGIDSTQFLRSDASDSTTGTSITTFHKLGFGGVGGNSNASSGNGYHFYQEAGAWTSPYPNLIMGYHTGVKFGAHKSYGGIRFYNDHPYNSSATKIMSVGEGTNDVRIQAGNLYFDSATSNKAWHAGNDGSGSGLDADLLDGQQGSYYYAASNPSGYLVNTSNSVITANPYSRIHSSDGTSPDNLGFDNRYQIFNYGVSSGIVGPIISFAGFSSYPMQLTANYSGGGTGIKYRTRNGDAGSWNSWYTLWHSGNDGSGSGLDADLLDGQQGSYYAEAAKTNRGENTSGVFPGTSGYNLNDVFTSFPRAGFIDAWSGTNFPTAATHVQGLQTRHATSTHYGWQLVGQYNQAQLWHRYVSNNSWSNWQQIWSSLTDGSGSGLDADTVDGVHASSFLTGNQTITLTGPVTGSGTTSISTSNPYQTSVNFGGSNGASPDSSMEYQQLSGVTDTKISPSGDWYNSIRMGHGDPYNYYSNTIAVKMTGSGAGQLFTQTISSGNGNGWKKHWSDSNDGSGSGLDADTVDGVHASSLYGVTSVATGGGLTGGTITSTGTISHADTSSVSNVNNSGNTFIQDITFDTYGHVQSVTSATATGGSGGSSSYDVKTAQISLTKAQVIANHGSGQGTILAGESGKIKIPIESFFCVSGTGTYSTSNAGANLVEFELRQSGGGATTTVSKLTKVQLAQLLSNGVRIRNRDIPQATGREYQPNVGTTVHLTNSSIPTGFNGTPFQKITIIIKYLEFNTSDYAH